METLSHLDERFLEAGRVVSVPFNLLGQPTLIATFLFEVEAQRSVNQAREPKCTLI